MSGSPGMGTSIGRGGGAIGKGLVVGLVACGLLIGTSDELWSQVTGQPPERKVEPQPRIPDVERTGQESPEAHEVRRGDTLWDLAGRYLANPFDWPRIFELNTDVVEDPHWIYPGERLRLPGGVARDATRVATEGRERRAAMPMAPQAPGRRGVSGFGGASVFDESPSSGDVLGPLGVEELSASALVSESDHHRAAFVADPASLGPMAVTARKIEGNPLGLSLPAAARRHHDVVLFLDGLAVEVGQRLQAIRWTRSLGESGDVASPLALLTVREVRGDSARATVVDVFGDYGVGDLVGPASSFELDPEARPTPVESGLVTSVLGFEIDQVLPAPGDMVFLAAGSAAGVELGDEFAVFSSDESRPAEAAWQDRVAVVRVVRVQPATATALVVDLQDVGTAPGSPARLVFRAGEG